MSAYGLPDGFPHALSDDDLAKTVESIMGSVYARHPADRVDTWLPELQLALVRLAISEQSRRELAQSSRIALFVLAVGVAALVVAIITVLVSA